MQNAQMGRHDILIMLILQTSCKQCIKTKRTLRPKPVYRHAWKKKWNQTTFTCDTRTDKWFISHLESNECFLLASTFCTVKCYIYIALSLYSCHCSHANFCTSTWNPRIHIEASLFDLFHTVSFRIVVYHGYDSFVTSIYLFFNLGMLSRLWWLSSLTFTGCVLWLSRCPAGLYVAVVYHYR
jgi:hypothetical protein